MVLPSHDHTRWDLFYRHSLVFKLLYDLLILGLDVVRVESKVILVQVVSESLILVCVDVHVIVVRVVFISVVVHTLNEHLIDKV